MFYDTMGQYSTCMDVDMGHGMAWIGWEGNRHLYICTLLGIFPLAFFFSSFRFSFLSIFIFDEMRYLFEKIPLI